MSTCCRSLRNFYPRPPRGGRQIVRVKLDVLPEISIHALREEGDLRSGSDVQAVQISIHALREEGDEPIDHCTHAAGISIHALREEGDICSLGYDQLAQIFLSTPSARRATARQRRDCLRQ